MKNNIPNYDFVPDFIKSLRRLPIGNFVSFPAEIARTGTNIVRRALREINETITLANGKVVKPFRSDWLHKTLWLWSYGSSYSLCND